MTIDELTNQLSAVYQSGKPYRFLRLAHAALAQVPSAPQLTALTLRTLTEFGYGGPARELLEQHPEMCADEAQRAELQQALSTLPNGRVAWRDQQNVFERNLRAIAERLVVQDDRAKAVFASRGLEECVHAPPGLRNEPSGAELRADLLTTY